MLGDESHYKAFLSRREPELNVRQFKGYLNNKREMTIVDDVSTIVPPEE
jgi:hypothetical protein